LDAGLRVLDDVKYLLDLDYKDSILAHNEPFLFKNQLSFLFLSTHPQLLHPHRQNRYS